MKTQEQTPAISTVESTIATLAADSASTTISLAVVEQLNKTIASKDEKIAHMMEQIIQLNENLSDQRVNLSGSEFKQGKIVLEDRRGNYDCRVINLDEAKAVIEKEVRKEFEAELKSLKLQIKALKQDLEEKAVVVDTIEAKHSAELLRVQLGYRTSTMEAQTKLDEVISDKNAEIAKLDLQVKRLTEGNEFSTIERENLELKKKLAKLNNKFINFGYFSAN